MVLLLLLLLLLGGAGGGGGRRLTGAAPAAGLRATRYIELLDKKRLPDKARGLEQAS